MRFEKMMAGCYRIRVLAGSSLNYWAQHKKNGVPGWTLTRVTVGADHELKVCRTLADCGREALRFNRQFMKGPT